MTMANQDEEPQSRFPVRLHLLLSQLERAGLTHIMSWLPCGTRFKIHDRESFTKEIMPKIGQCTRYKSFLRQLSMYKFQRMMSGPLKGTYHHPYFRRYNIDACKGVLRGREPIVINHHHHPDGTNSCPPPTMPATATRTAASSTQVENENPGGVTTMKVLEEIVPTAAISDGSTLLGGCSFGRTEDGTSTTTAGTRRIADLLAPEGYGNTPPFPSIGHDRRLAEEKHMEPVPPCAVKKDDVSSWLVHQQQATGSEEMKLFSSHQISSIPRRNKPTDIFPDLSISSLPGGGTSAMVMTSMLSTPAEEEGVEVTRRHFSRGTVTSTAEDIIDEIISTFTTI